jgi:hypothetical protein
MNNLQMENLKIASEYFGVSLKELLENKLDIEEELKKSSSETYRELCKQRIKFCEKEIKKIFKDFQNKLLTEI